MRRRVPLPTCGACGPSAIFILSTIGVTMRGREPTFVRNSVMLLYPPLTIRR